MLVKIEKRLKKCYNNKLSWYLVISNYFLNILFVVYVYVVCMVIICIKKIYINYIIYRVYICVLF